MAVLRFGSFQQRNVGFDGLQACQAALHIQLAAGAQVPTRLSQLLGVAQVGQGALGDVQLLLRAAQFEIVTRHFRRHRDLHVLQAGLLGFQVGTRRLRRTPLAAEQIQLPRRIQTQRGLLGEETLITGDHLLLFTAIEAALCSDVRRLVQPAFDEHRTRLLDARDGNAQIVVGEQCIAHQLFQHRVIELRPPVAHRRLGAIGRILRALQRHCGRRFGAVIRPDRATTQDRRGKRGAQQGPHHGSTSPRWVKLPLGPCASINAICTLLCAPCSTSISPTPPFMSVLT